MICREGPPRQTAFASQRRMSWSVLPPVAELSGACAKLAEDALRKKQWSVKAAIQYLAGSGLSDQSAIHQK